jgi:prepilin-type N-terminal cleavage/methylation domain-containing protein
MKIKNMNSQKGFTLIEILIYVAIFSMIVGALFAFSFSFDGSRLQSQLMLEVNDQGTSLIRTITQSIRGAVLVDTPMVGAIAETLSINTKNPISNPTVFFINNEALYVSEGASAQIALTNNKVKITNLVFSNVSRPATPGVIRIRFTLANKEGKYSVDFYGTAAIR